MGDASAEEVSAKVWPQNMKRILRDPKSWLCERQERVPSGLSDDGTDISDPQHQHTDDGARSISDILNDTHGKRNAQSLRHGAHRPRALCHQSEFSREKLWTSHKSRGNCRPYE